MTDKFLIRIKYATCKYYSFLFTCFYFSTTLMAQPVITSLTPSNGQIGSTVIINGAGFNTTPANNIVYFGGVKGLVSASSVSSLTVAVPNGYSAQPVSVTTNGFTASSPAPFIVTFPGGGPFNAGSFISKVDNPSPGFSYGIVSSDIDGDNKQDIITVNLSGQSFTVFKNSSTGTTVDFTNSTDFFIGKSVTCIAAGDIDGDGKQDIIIGSFNGDSIFVFRNTSTIGNISFAPRQNFHIPQSSSQISIGEIDGDGKPDIIIASDNYLSVILNTSVPGSLSLKPGVTVAGGIYVLAIADVNANGKIDLISGNGQNLLISNNNSSPGVVSFDAPITYPMGYEALSISVGDLNNDNKPDIAIANYNGTNAISILKNTGSGNIISFAPPLNLSTNHSVSDIQIADIDGDGKQDIVFSGNDFTKSISLLRNVSTATLSFQSQIDYVTSGESWRLAIADFTNDGRLDIASLSYTTNAISILRNKIGDLPVLSSFTPTTGGSGSQISINGSNLAGATVVSIGGVAPASVNVISDVNITVIIGASGSSGNVSVTTPGGTANLAGFIFSVPPSITSFTPLSGLVGQRVKITGTNFSSSAASNIVYFGGSKATVISATPTTIYVTVPPGSTYQPISVSKGGYTIYTKQPFSVKFAAGSLSSATFIKQISPPNIFNVDPNNSCLADIDEDGRTDIIVNAHGTSVGSYPYQDSFAIYRNTTVNGVISFANRLAFKTSGNYTINVSFADFDGDGKLDIIAMNQFLYSVNGSVDFFRNTSTPGNISFQGPFTYNVGIETGNIAIGDIDGGGKLDFSIADGSNSIKVFRNTSTLSVISFDGPQLYQLNTSSGGALSNYIGDIDGDGKPDIIATAASSDSFSIFKNTSIVGTINFDARKDFNAGHPTSFVTMGDIDGNGKQDLILGAGVYNNYSTGDSAIIIIKNQSTPGIFSFDPDIYSIISRPWNIVLSDLNGDGKPDLISAKSNTNTFKIYPNTSIPGHLSFAPTIDYVLPGNIQIEGIASGDLDGDGKPDIVLADESSVVMNVLINQNGSDTSFCPDSNGSISSEIMGTSYQWQLNTGNDYINITDNINFAGTNTAVLNLFNIPSNWYGYSFRCIVNGTSGKVSTIKVVNTWTGAVNSSWENPANWSCGTVPDINTDVIISSGTVVINSNVVIRSLKLDADVLFTLKPTFTIILTH